MQILIQAPFTLSPDQENAIKNQLSKLERYHNRMTQIEVYFKKGDGNALNATTSEIQVHVPGPVIFAASDGENAMTAFKGAFDKVERIMRKNKEMRK